VLPKQSNLLRVHLPQHRQHYLRHQSEAFAMNVRHAIFERVPASTINEQSAGWTSSPCAVGHCACHRHWEVGAVVYFRSPYVRVARLAAKIANTFRIQFSHFGFLLADPPGAALATVGRLLYAPSFQEPGNNRARNPEDAILPLAASRLALSEVNHSRLVSKKAAHRVFAHSQHFCHFRNSSELLVHVAILPVKSRYVLR
jgi:hypothetical protein